MSDDFFELSSADWNLLTSKTKKGKELSKPIEPKKSAEELGYDPVTLKNEPKFRHDLRQEYEIQRWNGTAWEYYPSEEYRFISATPEEVLKRVRKAKHRETFRINRFFVRLRGEK